MIEISHVDKWYNPTFQALKDCTTSVAKGEVVVVCGPSGSGKSTLIKCVNALEAFQKGQIVVDGISVGDPEAGGDVSRGDNLQVVGGVNDEHVPRGEPDQCRSARGTYFTPSAIAYRALNPRK